MGDDEVDIGVAAEDAGVEHVYNRPCGFEGYFDQGTGSAEVCGLACVRVGEHGGFEAV